MDLRDRLQRTDTRRTLIASNATFARAVLGIVHSDRGELAPAYDLNVSFLEALVEWLPQQLLDLFVIRAIAG